MRYRPIEPDELPLFGDVTGRSFRADPTQRVTQMQAGRYRFAVADARVIEEGARGMVAAMILFERGVSLEGRELRAGLINAVAVPPEQRRRGYADALMVGGLEEMRERGLPLSLLFPYSIPFYNRLGYGICSHHWLLEFDLRELHDFREVERVRRLEPEELPAMRALYRRERARHNGWLERTDWEWRENVFDLAGRSEWPARVEGVAVPGAGGELEGYLTYTLATRKPEEPTALTIREWVSEGDDAWRALAGFVAAQRAQARFVRYSAPEGFPLVHATKERNAFRDRREPEFAWRDTISMGGGLMLRLVDVARALALRPFPADLEIELTIRMRDPQLPQNERPLRLQLEGGRAAVSPARDAGPIASADAATWAELYSGTLRASDARRVGRLEADDTQVARLDAAFATQPWYIHRADWF